MSFWLPKILAAGGVSATATGWWAALPYGVGAVAMVLAGSLRGRGSLAAMYLMSATGFLGAGLVHGLPATLACFCFASMGVYGALPLFWSASTGRMSSKVAGAAIAIVNSLGATGGFAGPYAMGWLHDATHTYSAGLWAIAASVALGGATVSGVNLRRKRVVEQRHSPAKVGRPRIAPPLLNWNGMILPFVREIFAELEHSSAFERVRRHLSLGTGRRRVSGLTATARSLLLPLMARAAKQPVIVVVADNKAAEALEPMLQRGLRTDWRNGSRRGWCVCPPTMCFPLKISRLIPTCRSSAPRLFVSWPPARCPS